MSHKNRILLIVSGGIAAFKTLELIRLLNAISCDVTCILTRGGKNFVTPLSLASLSKNKVYEDLFSLNDENEMGHIELSKNCDLVLVAPGSADIIAKMRAGIADDLATTVLLCTKKPIFVAPAMNVRMWENAATRDNIKELASRGVNFIGPDKGEMACGEYGYGRLSEPTTIANYVSDFFISPEEPQINIEVSSQLLFGKKAVVTSGPTHEAIDPVRYVTNHSSGQQGHAIAQALSKHGAETVLVSGPTNLPNPHNIKVVNVKTAIQMLDACEKEMPADVVVCAAAVTDWRIEAPSKQKLKKSEKVKSLKLSENPDILAHLGQKRKNRPPLVIGFAAETENVEKNAKKKLLEKSCDWIVANNVGADTNTFGGDKNKVQLINKTKTESWPEMSKVDVGNRLAIKVAEHLSDLKP
jgi:phosphopantothenoylcysteine decarboxylase/phosphopantothenate--cysteine ligase